MNSPNFRVFHRQLCKVSSFMCLYKVAHGSKGIVIETPQP